MASDVIQVSTPGRICLFGEHQDYLGLPVIACAVSLRIRITGSLTHSRSITLHLPDIGSEERFGVPDSNPLPYVKKRDYLRSGLNVLLKQGFSFSRGFEGTVRGNIPINAGTSSSSALVTAWIGVLSRMSDQKRSLSAEEIARYAHEAEVLEFHEPGGMMDHITCSLGGVLAIEFEPNTRSVGLPAKLSTFVLGDSGEPKDTTSVLRTVKQRVQRILETVRSHEPTISLPSLMPGWPERVRHKISSEELKLLEGTIRNHEITREAKRILSDTEPDHKRIGALLNGHQAILRDVLRISTPKIDTMINEALSAGAVGAKVNGSGGGGCMFAYAPEGPEEVAKAIERAGGKAFIVQVDNGIRFESLNE